jgi:integrase/recombinase XerD
MGDPARVRVAGPLEPYAAGFAAELSRLGYTKNATTDQLRLLAHLSRWLAAEGLSAADLTAAVADAFLAARRGAGYTLWLSRKALTRCSTAGTGPGSKSPWRRCSRAIEGT